MPSPPKEITGPETPVRLLPALAVEHEQKLSQQQ
jgi:hypothetical protein